MVLARSHGLVLPEVRVDQRQGGAPEASMCGAGPSSVMWRTGGSKYGNIPTRCREGVMHQSKLEKKRCDELHLMQTGGLIRDLEAHPQPVYRLEIGDVLICKYLADFRYVDVETGAEVVEDTKGRQTREYVLKKKLMKALHGIEIQEVRR